jgi:DUF4097 and DUF4098 domain-containing protein YvlB
MPTLPRNRLVPIALALLLATGTAWSDETESKEIAVDVGQALEIDLDPGGSVIIEGWNEETVSVSYWESHGKLDAFEVEIAESRDGARIDVKQKDRRVNSSSLQFEIKVPWQFDVEFHSAGGSFTISGVEGRFTGRTGGGRLSFEDCKGEVRMKTGGGRISVVDSELDGKLSTGGGRVHIQDVVGNLRASSGGGNVTYDNVRNREGQLRGPRGPVEDHIEADTVMIQTAGGAINVDEAPAGASVMTGGGEVNVRNAKRFVEASTGGGNIRVEVEDGWVKAKTGAGDITVKIEGQGGEGDKVAHLMTGKGDVTLTVPRGFSMELDLDIGYTKNSRRDFKIITDLPFDEERTEDWDYSNGSPKKHIYGTGKVAGGKYMVKIRTTNGDIHIREDR